MLIPDRVDDNVRPISTSIVRDWSAEFVAITADVRALPFRRIMLDGEAVTHCLEGLPDFHRLMSRDGQASACLYFFDLLWLET